MSGFDIEQPGAAGGGGDNVLVNAVAVTDADLNDTTPVASAGRANCEFRTSGSGPGLVSVQTPSSIPVRISNIRTNVLISNSVAETAVVSETIPANALSTARGARLLAFGNFLNNTGATQTIRVQVKFGATTLWDVTSGTIATNANKRPFFLILELSNQSSASSQELGGSLIIGGTGGATTGEGPITSGSFFGMFNGTSAEATNVDKTLQVTITLSAANINLTFELMSGSLTLF